MTIDAVHDCPAAGNVPRVEIRKIVIVLAFVALLGYITWRYVRGKRDDGGQQPDRSLPPVTAPIQMLAVLLLAFVTANSATYYGGASTDVGEEAQALDDMYLTSFQLTDANRRDLQSDIICYGRATANYEWPAMANGEEAKQPTLWLTAMIKKFGDVKNEPSYSSLVSSQEQRAKARLHRNGVAKNNAVPPLVFWLMALVIAVALALYAYALPNKPKLGSVLAIGAAGLLFSIALFIVTDIGSPFSGMMTVGNGKIVKQTAYFETLFNKEFGPGQLPCNDMGDKLPSAVVPVIAGA